MWLEMSRDDVHGGKGWEFGTCLWSPTQKKGGDPWAFWTNLSRVRKGDIVFHLRGKRPKAAFVGHSTADADGYATANRPPDAGEWGRVGNYYRVPLTGFVRFENPIHLDDVFAQRAAELRHYFTTNRERAHAPKESLFYVIQADRLQCLNGAYLSEVSSRLAEILFGADFGSGLAASRLPAVSARTGEQLSLIAARVGQASFSDNVRQNYQHACCFPDCDVVEPHFLVGAHIARWADAQDLRGDTANGLCLCLFHDKAFETGLFTVNSECAVALNGKRAQASQWARKHLAPFAGRSLKVGNITPSLRALSLHWTRIGFSPEGPRT